MKEQNLYENSQNFKKTHLDVPSEIAETRVNIDNGMEDQYNICYIIAEIIDAVNSLDFLMGRNTLPP